MEVAPSSEANTTQTPSTPSLPSSPPVTSVASKIASALTLKEAGNAHFLASEWQPALQQYHLALLYVKGLNANGMAALAASAGPQVTAEQTQTVTDLTQTVRLNMAAALLKLGKAERAKAECSAVLEGQGGASLVKAWFRRAQAHIALKDMEKAKSDLLKAQELAPADKGVAQQLLLVAKWERDQEAATKAVYQNMFKS